MYQAKFYKKIDKDRIAEEVEREGFDPVCITDPPARVYSSHHHAETKRLVFLGGTMEVTVGDRTYDCKPGDKLIIPAGALHAEGQVQDPVTYIVTLRDPEPFLQALRMLDPASYPDPELLALDSELLAEFTRSIS